MRDRAKEKADSARELKAAQQANAAMILKQMADLHAMLTASQQHPSNAAAAGSMSNVSSCPAPVVDLDRAPVTDIADNKKREGKMEQSQKGTKNAAAPAQKKCKKPSRSPTPSRLVELGPFFF
eukprot:5604436-Pleurochrysis_carterae.AAC.1